MIVFLVCLFGLHFVQGIELGDPHGLKFDIHSTYAHSYEDYKPRDYKFEYGVSDPHTGDHKSQWEVRENGVVRGEYSLLEPDGTTRIVQYTADHDGFKAVVKKIGHAVHPETVQHQHVQHHHVQQPEIHHSQIIVPEIPQQPHFKSYDGGIENYANAHLLYSQSPFLENHGVYTQADVKIGEHGTVSLGNHEILGENVGIPRAPGIDYHSLVLNQGIENAHSIPEQIHIQDLPHIVSQPSLELQQPVHLSEPIQIQNYEHVLSQPSQEYQHSVQLPEPIHIQSYEQPIKYQHSAPIHIQDSTNIKEVKLDVPKYLGVNVEHPHGESSSSFIGRTGNIEDDSAYKTHGKSAEVNGWEVLRSKILEMLNIEKTDSGQYLFKRSVQKKDKKN